MIKFIKNLDFLEKNLKIECHRLKMILIVSEYNIPNLNFFFKIKADEVLWQKIY